jgi:hypothetical protein
MSESGDPTPLKLSRVRWVRPEVVIDWKSPLLDVPEYGGTGRYEACDVLARGADQAPFAEMDVGRHSNARSCAASAISFSFVESVSRANRSRRSIQLS